MKRTGIWKKYIALYLTTLLMVACTNELTENSTPDIAGLKPGDVALQLLPANMGIYRVQTRGTDPKTAQEQKINNVHVFVFKADGTYLEAQGNDAFQGYDYKEGSSIMVFNRNMFEPAGDAAKKAKVFVLANMPNNTFTPDASGHPEEIDSIEDFQEFVFNLPEFTATLPKEGLPMVGTAEVDFSPEGDGNNAVRVATIQLESLMARIDLNFDMDPTQESGSKQYPSLEFSRVGVYNFPSGGSVVPQLDDSSTSVTDNKEEKIQLKTIENVPEVNDFTGHIIREENPQALTLYMFEHARLAKNFTYPDGIHNDMERQRYKNNRAVEDAAYIELEGIYTNHNNYMYKVTYRLYPGSNAVDNFTIKNNCQYKNNITVKGITVNNEETEALLDTRVNIDTKVNPYFIEMLRERQHDAHFNITPMDVYIYEGGSVKVELADENGNTNNPPSWIRMEPKAVAIKSTNPDLYNIYNGNEKFATRAGDGKRKYFTTTLMDELDGQEGSKSYTVVSDNTTQTYEERIYFYFDENVPTEAQADKGEDVPERNAMLRITYTRPQGEEGEQTHTRYIPIVQSGMRAVRYTEEGSNPREYNFYIETYEEYLNYFDGKDQYDQTYDGLQWGFKGILTGLNRDDGNEYMAYGWRNTMTIMEKFRENSSSSEWEMTLNDKPRGATEYCYNKNMRNPDNYRVDKCNWYHPSIREIEKAMDKYYGTYREFQQNWYWSSNPGPYGDYQDTGSTSAGNITWTGEHPDYARATRSMLQSDGSYNHATSEANKPYAKKPDGTWDTPYNPDDWNDYWNSYPSIEVTEEGEGGYASRDKEFRIRAVYIPDSQINVRNEPSTDNSEYYN